MVIGKKFKYLWVNVGDVLALLRVVTLVDGFSAVEVLAQNFRHQLVLRGGLRVINIYLLPFDS